MHSSAKINSLACCFECVSPLPFCILSLAPCSLCIRRKLLVFSLEIFFIVYLVYIPCAVRKLNLASHHPLWQVFIASPSRSSKKHHCVFSCDVLHNLGRLNVCKTHSSYPSVCDISKEKSFSDYTAGLLRPLFMFSSVALFPRSFLSLCARIMP